MNKFEIIEKFKSEIPSREVQILLEQESIEYYSIQIDKLRKAVKTDDVGIIASTLDELGMLWAVTLKRDVIKALETNDTDKLLSITYNQLSKLTKRVKNWHSRIERLKR